MRRAVIGGLFEEQFLPGALDATTIGPGASPTPLLLFHRHDDWPVGKSINWQSQPRPGRHMATQQHRRRRTRREHGTPRRPRMHEHRIPTRHLKMGVPGEQRLRSDRRQVRPLPPRHRTTVRDVAGERRQLHRRTCAQRHHDRRPTALTTVMPCPPGAKVGDRMAYRGRPHASPTPATTDQTRPDDRRRVSPLVAGAAIGNTCYRMATGRRETVTTQARSTSTLAPYDRRVTPPGRDGMRRHGGSIFQGERPTHPVLIAFFRPNRPGRA